MQEEESLIGLLRSRLATAATAATAATEEESDRAAKKQACVGVVP